MAPRSQVYQSQMSVPVIDAPRVQRVDVSSGLEQAAVVQRQREARQANELRLEAMKSLTELRGQAETLPFDQREAYFEKNGQRIKGEFGKKFGALDFDAKAMFDQEFDQMFGLQSVDVLQSARKGEKDHNYAVMDETLLGLEGEASRAGSDAQRAFFLSKAGETIANGVLTGAIDEKQAADLGQKFKRGVDMNAVRALIERDPNDGLLALSQNKFTNLREEDRLAMIERAERKLQHQASMETASIARAEKQRKLLGEAIAKEGFDLVAKGQLTEGWLTQNRAVLDTSDYRMLVEASQEGGGVESSQALTDIYRKVYVEGADVSGEVLDALARKQIRASTAKALLDESKANTPARRAKSFITQYLKPSDINPTPAAAQQFAEAMAEFDRLFGANPKQDAMDLARKVVQRNSFIEFDQLTAIMPLPDYAVGGRRAFDEKATRAAATRAFMTKHGGNMEAVRRDPAFKAEVSKIDAFAEATRKLEAGQQTVTGKGKPK